MARAATKDTELHGKTIKENDRLLLWYIASNRDESVFPNPHKFDITRPGLADQHQAFGGRGRHFCLGANLARLELKLWIQQTLERFPGPGTGRRPDSGAGAVPQPVQLDPGAENIVTRADDNLVRSDEVGARPLAAARLGVPPPACGGERRS